MSRLLTNAGLQDNAGLYDQGGIYDFSALSFSGASSFDPLTLDPYLFFDAETSMRGTLEAFTLDLDPSKPQTLDVITATRAGTTATFRNSSGLIQVASPNTVRVDHVDGVPMILVEPSATNTIRWSEDSTAYNYGSGITFSASDILAPNGQASSFKMTPDGSDATHRGGSSYSGSYNSNAVVTMSVWLKTDGYDYFLKVGGFFGSESAVFDSLDGSLKSTEGNVISASSEDYGNGWFRYKVTYTFQNQINNGLLYSGVRLVKRDASNNPVELFDGTNETTGVLVYGTQFELGSIATSYIPTDNDVSGVTRPADLISIDGTAFTDFFNTGGEGTFYLEVVPTDILKTVRLLTGHGGSSSELILYTNNNSAQVQTFDGTNGANYGPALDSQVNRIGFSYSSTAMKGSINGGSEHSGNHDGSFSGKTSIKLGKDTPVPLHYKRLIYWPTHSSQL